MDERVVEILMLIMSQLKGENSAVDNLEVLSQDLLNRGYSQNEISSAFTWLFERFDRDIEELLRDRYADTTNSFRVLHELEEMIISPEAFGYLLQIHELQILSDFEFEMAIERSMMLGSSKIKEEEMKSIVASILAQRNSPNNGNFMIQVAGNQEIH